MIRGIAVSYLSTLYVELYDAKATDKVGIDTINTNAADCFIACDRFSIEIADIDDITIGLYQVDIRIAIYHHQSLSLLAPTDMTDICIAHAIDFVVGSDALVFLIILIEIV